MRHALLFGKLPTHGDFVARGVGGEQRDFFDRWLSDSLTAARQRAGDVFDELYDRAPPCRYIQHDGGQATGGIVAASIDSAGRRFPLVLALAGLDPANAPAAAERCEDLVHQAIAAGRLADDLYRAAEAVPLTDSETEAAALEDRWWTEGAEDLEPVEWRGRFPAGVLTMMLAGEARSDEFRR